MDYEDHRAGYNSKNFVVLARNGIIDVLLSDAGENNKILCVGAGTGEDIEILKKHGDVYAIDLNDGALSMIPDGLCTEKTRQDACNLSYPDNFFDVAVAFDVFEHIESDKKAVAEIHRVLKPEGRLFFSVPALKFLFGSHDRALGHFRRYTKNDLKSLMADYRDLCTHYWNSLFFSPIAGFKIIRRRSENGVDRAIFPGIINQVLCGLYFLENRLFSMGLHFPFGITLVGSCKK